MRAVTALVITVALAPCSLLVGLKGGSILLQETQKRQQETEQGDDKHFVTNPSPNLRVKTDDAAKPTGSASVKTGEEKPLFIFHVGPQTTGTDLIQKAASDLDDILKKDDFYFLPNVQIRELFQSCYVEKDSNCVERKSDFERELNEHFSKHHNVLISEDQFNEYYGDQSAEDKFFNEYLKPLLVNWRVRVIFNYRHFHEMLLTTYVGRQNSRRKSKQEWPEKIGLADFSFPDFIDRLARNAYQHPRAVKKRWEGRFSSVQVFNIHGQSNFVSGFFCKMIPEATSSCEYLQQKESDQQNMGVELQSLSQSVNFDWLAVEAFKRGLVNSSDYSRRDVARGFKGHAKSLGLNNLVDFPLKCLSPDQSEKLLNLSLNMEKEIVPEFAASPRGELALKSEFQKESKSKLFCSIDFDGVVRDEKWEPAFESFGCVPRRYSISKTSENEKHLPADFRDLDVELSFMGIGGQGTGTTWLAHYLRRCPDLAFSLNKEVHFWNMHRQQGLRWYSQQFPTRASCRTDEQPNNKLFQGEITPYYMSLPEEDIQEIRALFPKLRIIFIARDLVDRSWSQLRKDLGHKLVKGGVETMDPVDYTDEYFMDKLTKDRYAERSVYAAGLKLWYKHFPAEQILVLNFDDISKNPTGLLRQALNHIGVKDTEPYLESIKKDAESQVNGGSYNNLRPSLRQKLEDHFRPHAKEFNELLQEHGYSWALHEY